jgi:hypothetical protein
MQEHAVSYIELKEYFPVFWTRGYSRSLASTFGLVFEELAQKAPSDAVDLFERMLLLLREDYSRTQSRFQGRPGGVEQFTVAQSGSRAPDRYQASEGGSLGVLLSEISRPYLNHMFLFLSWPRGNKRFEEYFEMIAQPGFPKVVGW